MVQDYTEVKYFNLLTYMHIFKQMKPWASSFFTRRDFRVHFTNEETQAQKDLSGLLKVFQVVGGCVRLEVMCFDFLSRSFVYTEFLYGIMADNLTLQATPHD